MFVFSGIFGSGSTPSPENFLPKYALGAEEYELQEDVAPFSGAVPVPTAAFLGSATFLGLAIGTILEIDITVSVPRPESSAPEGVWKWIKTGTMDSWVIRPYEFPGIFRDGGTGSGIPDGVLEVALANGSERLIKAPASSLGSVAPGRYRPETDGGGRIIWVAPPKVVVVAVPGGVTSVVVAAPAGYDKSHLVSAVPRRLSGTVATLAVTHLDLTGTEAVVSFSTAPGEGGDFDLICLFDPTAPATS